ncbi:MAG TPA: hypothetical protein VIM07_12190 [Chitinophagaceae bacterium]
MKKFVLFLVLITASFSLVKAQDDKDKRSEKIQALKIAFITQKIELTSDEAQKFWPVYNRYETEIRQAYRDSRNGGDAIDNEEKVLNVKKKYRAEFIKVIGQPKTTILFNSEREFRGVLMRHLKDKPTQ